MGRAGGGMRRGDQGDHAGYVRPGRLGRVLDMRRRGVLALGIRPPRHRVEVSRRHLAEQHDEWAEQRRYLGLDVLSRSRAVLTTTDPAEATHLAITSAL